MLPPLEADATVGEAHAPTHRPHDAVVGLFPGPLAHSHANRSCIDLGLFLYCHTRNWTPVFGAFVQVIMP